MLAKPQEMRAELMWAPSLSGGKIQVLGQAAEASRVRPTGERVGKAGSAEGEK